MNDNYLVNNNIRNPRELMVKQNERGRQEMNIAKI